MIKTTDKNFKKNFMASFYGWDSTGLKATELVRDNLLFTIKSPRHRGTHLIDFRKMKG